MWEPYIGTKLIFLTFFQLCPCSPSKDITKIKEKVEDIGVNVALMRKSFKEKKALQPGKNKLPNQGLVNVKVSFFGKQGTAMDTIQQIADAVQKGLLYN